MCCLISVGDDGVCNCSGIYRGSSCEQDPSKKAIINPNLATCQIPCGGEFVVQGSDFVDGCKCRMTKTRVNNAILNLYNA